MQVHPSIITAMNTLMANGMPYDLASAYVGNMLVESAGSMDRGINPMAKSPLDSKGRFAYGSSQWRGGRQDKLKAFSDAYGMDFNTLPAQLKFLLAEISDSDYKDPTSYVQHGNLLNLIENNALSSPGSLSDAVEKAFYRADPRNIPGFTMENEENRKALEGYLKGLERRREFTNMVYNLGQDYFSQNQMQNQQTNNKRPSLINQLVGGLGKATGGLLGNKDGKINWGNLAMGFNQMTTNPSPTLDQAIMVRQQKEEELETLARNKAKAMSYIQSLPDGPMKSSLMAQLNAGMDVSDVFSEMYKTNNQMFDREYKLRGEFNKNKVVKDYRMMVGFYDGMVDKILNPDPASDIAIVFRYMKLLDPDSVVRETEYATAEKIGGVPAYIGAVFNKLQGGGSLTDTQRNAILKASKTLLDSKKAEYDSFVNEFGGVVDRTGRGQLDISNIIIDPMTFNQEKMNKADARIEEYSASLQGRNTEEFTALQEKLISLRNLNIETDVINQALVEGGVFRQDPSINLGRDFTINDLIQMYNDPTGLNEDQRQKLGAVIEDLLSIS